ncbi:MAG TPA: IucA/IucC family protein [Jatrophihabitantaceae bacterium]
MIALAACPSTCATADDVTTHTLLNCLVREVSGPEGQLTLDGHHLIIRLPRRDVLLRARVRRRSMTGAHRFEGAAQELQRGCWTDAGWRRVAGLVAEELGLRTGEPNREFVDQVVESHTAMAAGLAAREPGVAIDALDYLASEQSLVFGHRFHPTPKGRSGSATQWLPFAPEAGARVRLRHLGVPRELIREEAIGASPLAALDRDHAVLPVHPWQFELLRAHPDLQEALRDGRISDLGEGGGEPTVPTASVRTLWHPELNVFLKFSLNQRITNCVRKNADYELRGAVALTRLLAPVAADLGRHFPGTTVLAEPAYRTLDLGHRDLVEGFGVIVRDALPVAPGVTPLLAGAIADEHPTSPAQAAALIERGDSDPLDWWRAYLALVVPPVLHAYFHHGVVFEPHLQNVVVGVADDGRPRQVFLRDMEGTKLLPARHADALRDLPDDVQRQVTYDAQRGWNRVVYCLIVNHVAEVLAAVADRWPSLECDLWDEVAARLDAYAHEYGSSPQLRALLSGVPLPAKANLLIRWERRADRHAGYLALPSPFASSRRESREVAAR